jgi:hypothetical protein
MAATVNLKSVSAVCVEIDLIIAIEAEISIAVTVVPDV